MPRSAWGSKAQQRQIDVLHNDIAQVIKVGRIPTVPVASLSATSDLKTRGAAITFQIFALEGIDSFVLMRNFSRDPGSAQLIHTWPATSLKTTPQVFPVTLKYTDADSAIAGKIAFYWIKTIPVSQKTQGNVALSGPMEFDASNLPSALQITADYAIGQAYTPTTSPVGAVTGIPANSASIIIGAFQIQYPFDANNDGVPDLISYNGGTITPLLDATKYYVYFDDPTYAGGTQTYIASLSNPDVTSSLHRQYVGSVTTPAHGGGGTSGGGGGGGPCFTGNTLVITKDGIKPIRDICPHVDQVLTQRGWRTVLNLICHADFVGPLRAMVDSEEFVTPGHRFWFQHQWVRAEHIFTDRINQFGGNVFNLEIEGDGSDEEQCYTLANGWIAHNVQKF